MTQMESSKICSVWVIYHSRVLNRLLDESYALGLWVGDRLRIYPKEATAFDADPEVHLFSLQMYNKYWFLSLKLSSKNKIHPLLRPPDPDEHQKLGNQT